MTVRFTVFLWTCTPCAKTSGDFRFLRQANDDWLQNKASLWSWGRKLSLKKVSRETLCHGNLAPSFDVLVIMLVIPNCRHFLVLYIIFLFNFVSSVLSHSLPFPRRRQKYLATTYIPYYTQQTIIQYQCWHGRHNSLVILHTNKNDRCKYCQTRVSISNIYIVIVLRRMMPKFKSDMHESDWSVTSNAS